MGAVPSTEGPPPRPSPRKAGGGSRARSAPYETGAALALALALLAAGCTFSRVTTNEAVARLDPSFIRPGETTWEEVLARLGAPAPLDPITGEYDEFSPYYLHYASRDQYCFALNTWPYVTLPFLACDQQTVHEIAVEFYADGVVSDVHVIDREAILPPFESESGRAPPRVRKLAP